jgi:hypothetical protein
MITSVLDDNLRCQVWTIHLDANVKHGRKCRRVTTVDHPCCQIHELGTTKLLAALQHSQTVLCFFTVQRIFSDDICGHMSALDCATAVERSIKSCPVFE